MNGKVAVVNALQLEAARRHASRSGPVLANFILHMLTVCYFPASSQNFDVAVRFSDHILPKDGKNFVIKQRFLAVIP